MKQLHDISVENIDKGEVVVSGGMADYEPAKTGNFKAVFEQADTLMYEEKKSLKNMGAAKRL